MSELPELEVCRSVAAPPAKVWALVSDITRVGDWGGEWVHVKWIDGADGPGVGARFPRSPGSAGPGLDQRVGGDRGLTGCQLCVDGRRPAVRLCHLALSAGFGRIGGAILRYRAVMGPGPSGLSDAIAKAPEREDSIIADRLNEHARNMTATLEAIKQAAEQE